MTPQEQPAMNLKIIVKTREEKEAALKAFKKLGLTGGANYCVETIFSYPDGHYFYYDGKNVYVGSHVGQFSNDDSQEISLKELEELALNQPTNQPQGAKTIE